VCVCVSMCMGDKRGIYDGVPTLVYYVERSVDVFESSALHVTGRFEINGAWFDG